MTLNVLLSRKQTRDSRKGAKSEVGKPGKLIQTCLNQIIDRFIYLLCVNDAQSCAPFPDETNEVLYTGTRFVGYFLFFGLFYVYFMVFDYSLKNIKLEHVYFPAANHVPNNYHKQHFISRSGKWSHSIRTSVLYHILEILLPLPDKTTDYMYEPETGYFLCTCYFRRLWTELA